MAHETAVQAISAATERWIKATLANDENSTDEELVQYFSAGLFPEYPMAEAIARQWVSRRAEFMGRI